MREAMTIGRLAQAVGVNVETIRYYQRRGLIAEPSKPPGGQRRYTKATLDQLQFIKRAQLLGFTLDEVKELLQFHAKGNVEGARDVAQRRHDILSTQLERVEAMRDELARLIKLSTKKKTEGALFQALSSNGDLESGA
jgi:MerR family transcriptional regulator, mercuric resistance operon regulatory protein